MSMVTQTPPSHVPLDVLFDILDMLPAKTLCGLRLVSREFLDVTDSLLRGRFMSIMRDPSQELIFDSHQPMDYRKGRSQSLHFVDFIQRTTSVGRLVAQFDVARSSPQYFPMDDEEMFAGLLLSVHMRGVDIIPRDENGEEARPEPHRRGQEVFPDTPPDSRSGTPRSGSPLAIGASISPPRRVPFTAPYAAPLTPNSTPPSSVGRLSRLTFSFLLASGSDRVYRTWFEDETIKVTPPLGARQTTLRKLLPTGTSALVEAEINCISVMPSTQLQPCPFATKSSSYSSYGSGAYTATSPRLFEFYYSCLRLDVGKLVASLEGALDRGCCKSVKVVWLGH